MSSHLFKGAGAAAIPRYWETMGGPAVFCWEMPDRPCPAPHKSVQLACRVRPRPCNGPAGNGRIAGLRRPTLRGREHAGPDDCSSKTAPLAGWERSAGPAVNTLVAQCTAASPPLLRSWHTRLARPGGGRGRARRWGENGARKKSGARTFVSRKLPRPLMLTGLGSDHWRSNLGPKRSY